MKKLILFYTLAALSILGFSVSPFVQADEYQVPGAVKSDSKKVGEKTRTESQKAGKKAKKGGKKAATSTGNAVNDAGNKIKDAGK
jgi:hypothetical protein